MKKLTTAAVDHYRTHGFQAPIRAIPTDEAGTLRRKLEAHEARHGLLKGPLRHKSHLLFTWLDDLIRHPGILDAVEDIIGPNLLVWGSSFFIKEAHDPSFVSWHQDSTYWGLDPADIVTAWVALSRQHGRERRDARHPRQPQAGPDRRIATPSPRTTCCRAARRSRSRSTRPRRRMLELQPGEMSLHHVRLIHGSDPNPSGQRRIGFAIRYLPTYVRQIVGTHDSATLVRGVDDFHNFEPEQRPDADFSEAARAFHAKITGDHEQILMRDTGRTAAA